MTAVRADGSSCDEDATVHFDGKRWKCNKRMESSEKFDHVDATVRREGL